MLEKSICCLAKPEFYYFKHTTECNNKFRKRACLVNRIFWLQSFCPSSLVFALGTLYLTFFAIGNRDRTRLSPFMLHQTPKQLWGFFYEFSKYGPTAASFSIIFGLYKHGTLFWFCQIKKQILKSGFLHQDSNC